MPGTLIYLLPAMMDMILPAVFFMTQVAAAESGASASTVANFVTIWAAVYMVSSFLLGRVVTSRNAPGLILLSCAITAMLSVVLALTSTVQTMYILMALEGVGIALFFTPFQVFMRQVGENRQRSINASVGLYTFSWSIGFAAGPFVAALMWRYLGWRASHGFFALSAIFVAAMTWKLKHLNETRDGKRVEPWDYDATKVINVSPATPFLPDLAWMGWVFSGLGCLAARMMYGLFPSSAVVCQLPKVSQGLTLFILSATQAFVGLSLGFHRFRGWMYHPAPILISGLFGAGGLCLFALARSSGMFYFGAACFGLYSGTFFYYFVYHSLIHPEHSGRYIAINEATVGLTSMAGPFVGGLVADRWALGTSYHLTAMLVLVAVCIQTAIHLAYKRRMRMTRITKQSVGLTVAGTVAARQDIT